MSFCDVYRNSISISSAYPDKSYCTVSLILRAKSYRSLNSRSTEDQKTVAPWIVCWENKRHELHRPCVSFLLAQEKRSQHGKPKTENLKHQALVDFLFLWMNEIFLDQVKPSEPLLLGSQYGEKLKMLECVKKEARQLWANWEVLSGLAVF